MTPRQSACLIAIRDLTVDGVSPTLQEIADHIGAASRSKVHYLIAALLEQGHLRRPIGRRSYRNLEVVSSRLVTDADIARMDDDELASLGQRVSAAVALRRPLSQAMGELAA